MPMGDVLAERRRPVARVGISVGLAIAVLAALVVILFVISLLTGPANLGAMEIFGGLLGDQTSRISIVATHVRLPRAILAAAIGGVLGLTGAALQGYLRNPLADPGLIGASSSAAFGAVLAIYSGFSIAFPLALPLSGMVGAGVAVVLIYALVGRDDSVLTLILAGLAINTLAGSLTALALNLAENPHAALEIAFWILGSLQDRTLDHVALALPFMGIGTVLVLVGGRELDALSLGQKTGQSLGVNLGRLRLRIIAGTALAVGSSVAVAGSIGFIGLLVPHLIRPVVGPLPSRLLLASMLAGSALLLAADIAVRLIPTNSELKLGVVTGLLGAPFFLALLLKIRRQAP
jgi:iron complex transport system permease protein